MTWSGITGSGGDDASACPARLALPKCREPSGEAADRGNELHAFARCVTLDPPNRETYVLAMSKDYQDTARGMDLEEALKDIKVLGCEVAFVLNTKDLTCRRIGDNIDRQYAFKTVLTKYDVPFTVDVLGWSTTLNCPVELDYKSGMSIGSVEEHGQRRISSAGLMLHYGADTSISRVAYISESGGITPDGHEFALLDAYDTCDKLRVTADRVEVSRAVVEAGKVPDVFPDRERQCRYCDAYNACPYWNNLVKSAVAGGITPIDPDGPYTEQQFALAYDQTKDVLAAFEKVKDKLQARIHKAPLVLDEKWEYSAKHQKGKKSFDIASAKGLLIQALSAAGYDQEEIDSKLAGLMKEGAPYPVIRKRKRELPMFKNSA